MSDNKTVRMQASSDLTTAALVITEFGNTLTLDESGQVDVPVHLVSRFLDAGWTIVTQV